MRRLLKVLEPLLWVGLGLFVLARFGPQIQAWTGIGPPPERSVPGELEVVTLDGARLGPAELDGRVRVFTFWATWCRVCHFELPAVQSVHEAWEGSGEVAVVGLSIDRAGPSVVRDHLNERGFTFPVAMATPRLRRTLGISGAIPTSVIVDRDGRVHHVLIGITGPGTLQRAVRRLVDR